MPFTAPDPIETARVVIRLVTEADLAALLEVNSDAEVTSLLPYATWTSMADAAAWYQRMVGIQATGMALQFVVVSKTDDKAIGTCLIFRLEEGSARAELGYVLGRPHWGKGLMREALAGLLGRAFGAMALRRIEAEVDPRNVASTGLLRRLGFQKEGVLRERWVVKGQTRTVEMYGLLRDEWDSTGTAGSSRPA